MRDLPAEPNVGKFVLRADIGNMERSVLAYPVNLRLINTDLDAPGVWVWNQNEPAEP